MQANGNVYTARAQFLDFGLARMGIVLNLAGKNAAEKVPPLFFRQHGWKSKGFTWCGASESRSTRAWR